MVPVVSIVGRSDVGKTTLIEKLLVELKARGYTVATIKHDVHGFDLDKPGKDTWRYAQAGSDVVVISSPWKLAIIQKVEEEMSLDDLVSRIEGVDIILTEGYKRGDKLKIEVTRRELYGEPLCGPEDNLIAVVGDIQVDGVPSFDSSQIPEVVDFLETKLGLKPRGEPA